MRRLGMLILVAIVGHLFAPSGTFANDNLFSQPILATGNLSDTEMQNLATFKSAVRAAAVKTGVADRAMEIYVSTGNPQGDLAQTWLLLEPSTLGRTKLFAIYVWVGLLGTGIDVSLQQHVATHEVCHIKNGDIDGQRIGNTPEEQALIAQREHLAEKCVYETDGADAYLAFLRDRSRHVKISWLGSMTDSELRARLSKIYGEPSMQ